jgi:hypothetical protein
MNCAFCSGTTNFSNQGFFDCQILFLGEGWIKGKNWGKKSSKDFTVSVRLDFFVFPK